MWFAAGAGAGVYALVRARRAAEALTPEGLGDRLAALSLGLRMLRSEVQAGMAEKENDLRERLVLALPGSSTPTVPELPASRTPRTGHLGDPATDSTTPQPREGND
jgi:hypothetical protein